jgi:alpha-L-fucosidase
MLCAAQIEPSWDLLAADYQVPDWFVDGKLGVWFHWGIPSSIDDGRPHDGSHYGAWMYGTEGQLSAAKHPEAVQRLTDWHNKHYGHYSEFGYEDLIPMFKAEMWDPDALVKLVKEVGARFIMPVACHHDNFDMYDSSHPWNSVAMGPHRDTLKGDGTIPDAQMEYLEAFRKLMKENGEGIYGSCPWKVFGEGPLVIKDGHGNENLKSFCQEDIRFTAKEGALYAFVLALPTKDIMIKTLATGALYNDEIAEVSMLGSDERIEWDRTAAGLAINGPQSLPGRTVVGFKISAK